MAAQDCEALIIAAHSLAEAVKELPAPGIDFNFYVTFPEASKAFASGSKRTGELLQTFLGHVQEFGRRENPLPNEDIEYGLYSEYNDAVFERIDTVLDRLRKGTSNAAVKAGPTAKQSSALGSSNFGLGRPQLYFKDKVDNSPDSPFIPKLRSKPNAVVPLDEILVEFIDAEEKLKNDAQGSYRVPNAGTVIPDKVREHMENMGIIQEDDEVNKQNTDTRPGGVHSVVGTGFPHPYQTELETFSASEEQLQRRPEIHAPLLKDTTPVWIDNVEELESLLKTLKACKEFAVDLEHHSFRSYQGFTCLMQISTRSQDFLVDAIELRAHMERLNEVFTDPAIVKVLHGADSDVLWLQKDFGLYMVNMFDTGQAARVLQLPQYSLAYLLQTFVKIQADKQYQLADWRIRPIPPAMLQYAQQDTHHLLFIYDRMVNLLLDMGNASQNLLRSVIDRSTEVCLQKYEKPQYSEESWQKMYAKYDRQMSAVQKVVLRALHQWRDKIARLEDESPVYVLPNHMLLAIAEKQPTEISAMLSCCSPEPPLLCVYCADVIRLVKDAALDLDVLEAVESAQAAISTRPIEAMFSSAGGSQAVHGADAVLSHSAMTAEVEASQWLKAATGHSAPLKQAQVSEVLGQMPCSVSRTTQTTLQDIANSFDTWYVADDDKYEPPTEGSGTELGEAVAQERSQTIVTVEEEEIVPEEIEAVNEPKTPQALRYLHKTQSTNSKRARGFSNRHESTSKNKKPKLKGGSAQQNQVKTFEYSTIPSLIGSTNASAEDSKALSVKSGGQRNLKAGATGFTPKEVDYGKVPRSQVGNKRGERSRVFKK
eukprot:Clim_evm38s225 gene=Clim_evmTU38s225